jgi:hypothetical protein
MGGQRMEWERVEELNIYTGRVNVRHLAQVKTSDRRGRAYLEVARIGNKYQWSVHVVVTHRPDLSRRCYRSIAATPHALPVAKMIASRRALKTIRAVEPLTLAA